MGVYFPDDKMPDSCLDCSYCGYSINLGYYCRKQKKPLSGSTSALAAGRSSGCPMVEIKKHRRLIDAASLKGENTEDASGRGYR